MKLINPQSNFPIRDANVKTIRLKKEALEERAHQILMGNVDLNSLPFDDIFGKKYRVSFPLMNETLSNIIDLLKKGETKTGKKYDVDLSTQMATYEVENRNGDLVKKQVKAGKVIGRELGPNYLDHWAKGLTGQGKHIVVSRHPIDIARMSDHDRWSSCHAPPHKNRTGYDAWKSALNEAEDGGLVAYVVDSKDIGRVKLQEEEIFQDPERDIDGIVPNSRVRLNRYHSEAYDLAIPVTTVYGDNNDGFLESVKDWAYNAQKGKFQEDEEDEELYLYMENFKRKGGSYADEPNDSEMFNYFFGTDRFSGSVEFTGEGGQSQTEIWEDEIAAIDTKFASQLKYFSVSASTEMYDDGPDHMYMYMYASLNFDFPSSEELNDEKDSIIYRYFGYQGGFNEHTKRSHWSFGYSDSSVREGELTVRLDLENLDVSTPDEYREKIEELINFEAEEYLNLKYKIYKDLAQMRAVDNVTSEKLNIINGSNFTNFEVAEDEEDDLDDETHLIDISANIALQPMPWGFQATPEFVEIYDAVLSEIKLIVNRNNQPALFEDFEEDVLPAPSIKFLCGSDKTNLKIYSKVPILESSNSEFNSFISSMRALDVNFEELRAKCVEVFYNKSVEVLYSGDLWLEKVYKSPCYISLIPEEIYNNSEFKSSLVEKLKGVFEGKPIRHFNDKFEKYFNSSTMSCPEYVEAFIGWVDFMKIPIPSSYHNDSKQKSLRKLLHNVVKQFPEVYNLLLDDVGASEVFERINYFLSDGRIQQAAQLLNQIVGKEDFEKYYAMVRKAYVDNLDYDACRASNFPIEFMKDDFVKKEMIQFLLQSGLSYKDISADHNLVYCIRKVALNLGYYEEREQRKEQENVEANSNWYKLHKESVK